MQFRLLLLFVAAAVWPAATNIFAAPRSAVLPTPALVPALVMARADAPAGAANDDTDFLFRLGMLEGHLLIGHELLQAHQPALAVPHFGHPVKELYNDLAEYLKAKGFPRFDTQLVALEAAVVTAPEAADTEAKYNAVITTVHRAREVAPAALRASLPEMIKVCSDTIDAASGEYGEALERDRIASVIEYHDSRGYLGYVDQQVRELKAAHPDPQAQAMLDRFKSVLVKAQWIVGELMPAPTPRASLSDYRALAAEAASIAKP